MSRVDFNPHKDIDPDEIFLDDKNIPEFDVHQFEGRMEEPEKIVTQLSDFFLSSQTLIGKNALVTKRAGRTIHRI